MVGKELGTQLPLSQSQNAGAFKRHNTCVILHIYYADMLGEIKSHLSNLGKHFDLYATIPYEVDISEDELRAVFLGVHIYRCENRGRDIAPFLKIFSDISKIGYKYICKIHTKKSPHIVNGIEWHQDMLAKLLGSRKIIFQIKKAFDQHPDWGMIAPSGHIVPHDYYWNQNAKNVIRLADSVNIPTDDLGFSFVAGSMFWFRPQALQLVLKEEIHTSVFDLELGQQDGTLAHAYERLFGMAVNHSGFKMAESDGEGLRLAEIPFHFRLLLQEFQKQEKAIQSLSVLVSRPGQALMGYYFDQFRQLIYKILKAFRSLTK
jgi:lipopolysaccharide biosynthesis protein